MKLALAQINTTVGDFSGNVALILKNLRNAEQKGAALVVFPELALSGYPPKDLLEREDFLQAGETALQQILRQVKNTAVLLGAVTRNENPNRAKSIYNSALLLHQGKVLGVYHKRLLPTYDVFDEGRYFEAGTHSQLLTLGGKKIGVSICEDIWNDKLYWGRCPYPADPIAEQARLGADLLINISASPFARGKGQARYELLARQVRQAGVPLFYLNLVGGNDDLVFDGSSLVFNKRGELVSQLAAFKEDFKIFSTQALKKMTLPKNNELELILAALGLGLRDYLHKCGFERVVLGLSGGIDSALTAWIAAQALGPKNVLGVSLPSKFSSSHALRDAEKLAQALKIEYRVLPIKDLYESSKDLLGEKEGKKINLTLQNIQARLRGNLLMALSNAGKRLLLSTGNKSELAKCYCTLYGDMAGGLALLADVPKTLVYALARFANRKQTAIPSSTLSKAPSAELAPNQKDQDELPDYKILDAILEAYIEAGCSPQEIVERGFKAKTVEWVLQRLDSNEYKREQSPPGIRISAKAFGYGRRVPLSSRYRVKI